MPQQEHYTSFELPVTRYIRYTLTAAPCTNDVSARYTINPQPQQELMEASFCETSAAVIVPS
jgi:hypothetical protein